MKREQQPPRTSKMQRAKVRAVFVILPLLFCVIAGLLYMYFGAPDTSTTTQKNLGLGLMIAAGTASVLLLLYLAVHAFRAWQKFWFRWLPNWLSLGIGLPRQQIISVYFVICTLFGYILLSWIGHFYNELLIVVMVAYGILSIITLVRLHHLFQRSPRSPSGAHIQPLGETEHPTRIQLLSRPGKNHRNVQKLLAYQQIAAKYPMLPDYETLEGQLFACLQSYASLQQGNDTEDARLSREIRAGSMAQHIALTAANLTHQFQLSELELFSIDGIEATDAPQNSRTQTFVAYIYANLSEAINDTQSTQQTPPTTLKTAFCIEFSLSAGHIHVHSLTPEESAIERYMVLRDINTFAGKHTLIYTPRLARFLLPKTGLLTLPSVLGQWPLASNLVVGHTEHHAYYLVTVQPYIRWQRRESYVVGVTIIPKTHDRLIIADKQSQLYQQAQLLPIQRITTESSDFSARYGIFIEQESTVPSLELLNPGLMQLLLDLPYALTIEVIGKHLYIYLPTHEASAAHYETVLGIMAKAHRELRL